MKTMTLILTALFALNSLADSTLIYEAQKKGITLTERDQEVLDIGEISTARYVTGGILGTYPIGFGVGHAIQGRWSQDGWIFTAGELISVAAIVGGLLGCVDNAFDDQKCSDVERTLVGAGVIGFFGFRIWEIVDVWAVPPSQNKKYRKLKNYIENSEEKKTTKTSLDLTPLFHPRNGSGLALTLSF